MPNQDRNVAISFQANNFSQLSRMVGGNPGMQRVLGRCYTEAREQVSAHRVAETYKKRRSREDGRFEFVVLEECEPRNLRLKKRDKYALKVSSNGLRRNEPNITIALYLSDILGDSPSKFLINNLLNSESLNKIIHIMDSNNANDDFNMKADFLSDPKTQSNLKERVNEEDFDRTSLSSESVEKLSEMRKFLINKKIY